MQEQQQNETKQSLRQSLLLCASSTAPIEIAALIAHNPTVGAIGVIAGMVAWREGPKMYQGFKRYLPQSIQDTIAEVAQPVEVTLSRNRIQPKQDKETLLVTSGRVTDVDDDEDIDFEGMQSDNELKPFRTGLFTFSEVLRSFTPSLTNIYLASQDGKPLYCMARDLCHVALAGNTGGGKSSTMRMLMAQLCKAGANVLLLNPHYTDYDLEYDEDWTPFKPYLMHDPLECTEYSVIEFYLKQVATVLLPKRLARRKQSLPLGKPYFIVMDELPAIIKKIPAVPGYLEDILREGRKVGIYLIVASQDFLVKTISPNGGGAVRDCYRTAYYSGGDATTANILLDVPAKEIPEHELGKGQVMFRGGSVVKKAVRATVPYTDNEALYRLLGPSTYVPTATHEREVALEKFTPVHQELPEQRVQPRVYAPLPQRRDESGVQPVTPIRPYIVSVQQEREVTQPLQQNQTETTGHFTSALTKEQQAALRLYKDGMGLRNFAALMTQEGFEMGKDKAAIVIKTLKAKRLIA